MADVTGPISTLPGSSHCLPNNAMCDLHPDRPAVARIQGETDSFGSEMNDMCEGCLSAYRKSRNHPDARKGRCDWCKQDAADLSATRDYDEGMAGPVYRVCGPCRKKYHDGIAAELDERDAEFDYGDDYDDFDEDDHL